MLSAAQLTQLQTELQTDPTALGYAPHVAAGNDTAVALLLNTVRDTISITKKLVNAYDIVAAVDPAEYIALSANDKEWIKFLVMTATVDVSPAWIRTKLGAMFAVNSLTRPRLVAFSTRTGTRAEQLFGIDVSVTDLEIGRALGRIA